MLGDTLLFQIKSPSTYLFHDLHLFNFYEHDKYDHSIKTRYKTETCILIQNVHSKQVIFSNNIFKNNIGLHGGAIHINNELIPFPRSPTQKM